MKYYDVKFKKKFGQNFLRDSSVVKRIVAAAQVDKESLVIEVGPGGAIMTQKLAYQAKNVLAYEIDDDLKTELALKLEGFFNVEVLFKDFLQANITEDISKYDFKNLFFISNIPYYITTPIILKLINSGLKFKKIVLMVQKEVGDRLSAKCGRKEYGSITVLLNYFYDVKKEFLVSRKQFVPEPNVDSVVVSFTEKKEKLELVDFSFFEKLIRDSFQYKRKNIKNNLVNYNLKIVESVLNKYGFDLNIRAEALSYEIFVDLTNSLYAAKKNL